MKQNFYTAKDIDRYHRGELSAAEMHALEKAALDDPFLADALEGYVFTQTATEDITALKEQLQKRIAKEEKKTPVFVIGNNWMKIAALFILIAGGGWLVFQTFSDKQPELAVTTEKEKQTPVNGETLPSTSDNAINRNDSIIVNANPTTPVDQTIVQHNTGEKDKAVQKNAENFAAVDPVIVQTAPPSTFYRQAPFDSLKSDAYTRSEQGYLKSETADTNLNQSAFLKEKMADRIRGVTSNNDTTKNIDVVLQRSDNDLEEVVVMKSSPIKPEAKKRMQVKVDTLQPAEGWTNFDDYIAGNLRMPEEFRAKPLKGEVELAFDVNKQGDPVNITVTKSLCEKCDEEAIRLLKEGPKWKRNKKKGKVTIRF